MARRLLVFAVTASLCAGGVSPAAAQVKDLLGPIGNNDEFAGAPNGSDSSQGSGGDDSSSDAGYGAAGAALGELLAQWLGHVIDGWHKHKQLKKQEQQLKEQEQEAAREAAARAAARRREKREADRRGAAKIDQITQSIDQSLARWRADEKTMASESDPDHLIAAAQQDTSNASALRDAARQASLQGDPQTAAAYHAEAEAYDNAARALGSTASWAALDQKAATLASVTGVAPSTGEDPFSAALSPGLPGGGASPSVTGDPFSAALSGGGVPSSATQNPFSAALSGDDGDAAQRSSVGFQHKIAHDVTKAANGSAENPSVAGRVNALGALRDHTVTYIGRLGEQLTRDLTGIPGGRPGTPDGGQPDRDRHDKPVQDLFNQ